MDKIEEAARVLQGRAVTETNQGWGKLGEPAR
jgi:hypothetical protein